MTGTDGVSGRRLDRQLVGRLAGQHGDRVLQLGPLDAHAMRCGLGRLQLGLRR